MPSWRVQDGRRTNEGPFRSPRGRASAASGGSVLYHAKTNGARGSIPHNGGGYGGEKTMKIPPPFDLARVRYCLSSFLSIRFESELFLSSIFLILFFSQPRSTC